MQTIIMGKIIQKCNSFEGILLWGQFNLSPTETQWRIQALPSGGANLKGGGGGTNVIF